MCVVTRETDVLIERIRGSYVATSVIPDETGNGTYSIITYRKDGQLYCNVSWDSGDGEDQDYDPVPGPAVGRGYKEQLHCFHMEKVTRMQGCVDNRYLR